METDLSICRSKHIFWKFETLLPKIRTNLLKLLQRKKIIRLTEDDITIKNTGNALTFYWQDELVGEMVFNFDAGNIDFKSLFTINVLLKTKYKDEFFVLKKIFDQTKEKLIAKWYDLNNMEFRWIGELAIKYLINLALQKSIQKINILHYNDKSLKFYYKVLSKFQKQSIIKDFEDIFWERNIIIHL